MNKRQFLKSTIGGAAIALTPSIVMGSAHNHNDKEVINFLKQEITEKFQSKFMFNNPRVWTRITNELDKYLISCPLVFDHVIACDESNNITKSETIAIDVVVKLNKNNEFIYLPIRIRK